MGTRKRKRCAANIGGAGFADGIAKTTGTDQVVSGVSLDQQQQ
jgi:hypothetical protein